MNRPLEQQINLFNRKVSTYLTKYTEQEHHIDLIWTAENEVKVLTEPVEQRGLIIIFIQKVFQRSYICNYWQSERGSTEMLPQCKRFSRERAFTDILKQKLSSKRFQDYFPWSCQEILQRNPSNQNRGAWLLNRSQPQEGLESSSKAVKNWPYENSKKE